MSSEQVLLLIEQLRLYVHSQQAPLDVEVREELQAFCRQVYEKPSDAQAPTDIDINRLFEPVEKLFISSKLPEVEPQFPENAQSLQRVYKQLEKLRAHIMALAKGDLNHRLDINGYVAGAVKSLQANLRHLTWQTKQVAAGDFSQRVDFMGEFATGFNSMIMQLDEMTNQLKDRNCQLQQEVDARQKAENELTRALSHLQAVNTDLQSFAYVISHDLKAPLRGIVSIATWIQQDYKANLDESGCEQLTLLVERAKKLTEMIDGVLHYSRMGSLEDSHELINVRQLVEETFGLLNPPERIKLVIDGNLPYIIADPVRISQLYQNLMSNAVRYIDKPEGVITVSLRHGEETVFTVADNGPGICEKDQTRIFDLFQTGTAKVEGSTGVGLAVVKRVCEFYGGNIWVESQLGEGSCFCFTLPNTKP
ncbi:MAG: ATP-binding protein [Armatimonadota bacterium]